MYGTFLLPGQAPGEVASLSPPGQVSCLFLSSGHKWPSGARALLFPPGLAETLAKEAGGLW